MTARDDEVYCRVAGGHGAASYGRVTGHVINAATGKNFKATGDTTGLLYPPEKVLSELSKVLTLEPGDIIFTGTDKAYVVAAGDEITVEFEGLGKLTNRLTK